MSRLAVLTSLAALLALACAPEEGTPVRVDEETIHPGAPPLAPFTECSVTTAREPATSAAHETACTEIDYPFHPPASGRHYSQWADFGTYDAPVPWGFLVHSMEHGAIVLAYRCEPDECDALVATLQEIADSRVDPLCRAGDTPSRFVIVPDPTLDVALAAVAWEHVYLATCLDRESLEAFVDAHYAQAPEDLCASGVDRSASGWCG
ncbi:DUF3105 domain-containing protein [Sandaracinus amylolyticus]|uniref:DUF3105 domain-containing protein n=1 Tax=Sandaracinus amylolyticus TaxID=927083 RepID=A0A0F6YG55_9BACT|nr:DUF3105 domain-containing protein [Sandaracinus amylolyticus]AKF03451.1 Hypothetical protein DB32_000600 [Sandaracinus amylolyticus]